MTKMEGKSVRKLNGKNQKKKERQCKEGNVKGEKCEGNERKKEISNGKWKRNKIKRECVIRKGEQERKMEGKTESRILSQNVPA